MTRSFSVVAALAALAALASPANAQDKVVKSTNWKAQAEHGGYYQAVAKGIYAKYGLDVTIRQGGPQIDNNLLMLAGRVDFNMGGNSDSVFAFVEKDLPFRAVAAIFQKDPQIIMSHPGVGNDTLPALKGKRILISKTGLVSFYPYLKKLYGFTDEMVVPYTFNLAPFLADKQMSQQGYATAEPFQAIRAGVKPVVHLLADYGYRTYSTTIEVSQKLIDEKPELVQRFVDASILGWKDYIFGDPTPGNVLIKKDNPDMTDDQIAFSIEAMKHHGIVDSGDTKTLGIGAMTDKRWKEQFDDAVSLGLYKPSMDYTKAYTTKFVNKRVGM
jgi:NitT/TauT family transport system substrate-binding protein